MKTLKKSLCLVLALVMVLGLCVVGTSAAYTDADIVAASAHADAIAIVSDLGFMKGNDKAEFDAEGTLTRAAAAKLVATVHLGDPKMADALQGIKAATGFADVDSINNYWAAGYIQYCKKAGIIAGDGNGNFNPDAKVTGLQFAKMILAALGYNAEKELEGEGWDVNTFVKGSQTGILVQDMDSNDAMTRAQAAQCVANSLTVEKQVYNVLLKTYADDGSFADAAAHKITGLEGIVYALVTANQSTDALAKGTTVKVYDGKDYTNEVLLTGYVSDASVIGHVVRLVYKTEKNNVSSAIIFEDVSTPVTAAEIDALTNKAPLLFTYEDSVNTTVAGTKIDTVNKYTPGTFVKYPTGEYANFTTSYKIGYVKEVDTKTGTMTVALKSEDVANVPAYDGVMVTDYVKYSFVGGVKSAVKLGYKDVKVTQVGKDSEGNYTYNNGALSKDPHETNVGAYTAPTMADGQDYRFFMSSDTTYFYVMPKPVELTDGTLYALYLGDRVDTSVTPNVTYHQFATASGKYAEYAAATGDSLTQYSIYVIESGESGKTIYREYTTGLKQYTIASAAVGARLGEASFFTEDSKVVTVGEKNATTNMYPVSAAKPTGKVKATVYTIENAANGTVMNIAAAWCVMTGPVEAEARTDSFIYVNYDAVTSNYIDGKTVYAHSVYVDGVATGIVSDKGAAAYAAGFYKYSVTNGVYTLDVITPETVTFGKDEAKYLYNGIVYDTANATYALNLNGVTIVDVYGYAITDLAGLAAKAATNAVTIKYVANAATGAIAAVYITAY